LQKNIPQTSRKIVFFEFNPDYALGSYCNYLLVQIHFKSSKKQGSLWFYHFFMDFCTNHFRSNSYALSGFKALL